MAKALDLPYQPGKRVMLKIKHARTADAVVVGYRVHKSGPGRRLAAAGPVHRRRASLVNVGGISAFTNARRLELVDELADLVVTDEHGEAVKGETDRSRFSGNKDVSFVRLRPERVVEVKFDQLEGARFRHAVTFLRWRPDREPESCTPRPGGPRHRLRPRRGAHALTGDRRSSLVLHQSTASTAPKRGLSPPSRGRDDRAVAGGEPVHSPGRLPEGGDHP